jgi:tetratricopeptide (TPR) repeat protein
MHSTRRFSGILSFLSFALLFPLSARAQEKWDWPEKPKNLQVLNKDWPGKRLQPVMIGFTRALGVRCSYCHKGVEGQPLSTYDFASDENPNKDRAREMLRMLGDINDHLKKIQPSGDQRVNMWCHTCHHGQPRPMTLEEKLGEDYRTKGIKAALDDYTELKKKLYGRSAYDFSEGSLNGFGYSLLEKKDAAAAIQIFKLNADAFPESANTWDSLAEAYMKSGDPRNAQLNYEKSLTLDPKNQNAIDMLKKLKESPKE